MLRTEQTTDAPIVVFDAAHRNDAEGSSKGGGKSLQFHVDVTNRAVVNELNHQ